MLRALEENKRVARRTIRLDAPISDDEECPSISLEEEAAPGTEEQSLARARAWEVRRAIASLEPRQRHVLVLYFGLDGSQPLTLEEIAFVYGLSRERIRQIKESALRRLRRTRRARLESFHF